ncbi:hypothetical protein DFP72DRAFT_1169091 [Ephemerocybe angulata]|uniref:Uncharacterized protein n=1 Tax=Ephemerocybe angulata TaxID=980116 RepID=A0A8H6HZC4_9AGAR|nr:hypothetical protein DFP72DRAFT_1169091 [Tulosesus angulatus]
MPQNIPSPPPIVLPKQHATPSKPDPNSPPSPPAYTSPSYSSPPPCPPAPNPPTPPSISPADALPAPPAEEIPATTAPPAVEIPAAPAPAGGGATYRVFAALPASSEHRLEDEGFVVAPPSLTRIATNAEEFPFDAQLDAEGVLAAGARAGKTTSSTWSRSPFPAPVLNLIQPARNRCAAISPSPRPSSGGSLVAFELQTIVEGHPIKHRTPPKPIQTPHPLLFPHPSSLPHPTLQQHSQSCFHPLHHRHSPQTILAPAMEIPAPAPAPAPAPTPAPAPAPTYGVRAALSPPPPPCHTLPKRTTPNLTSSLHPLIHARPTRSGPALVSTSRRDCRNLATNMGTREGFGRRMVPVGVAFTSVLAFVPVLVEVEPALELAEIAALDVEPSPPSPVIIPTNAELFPFVGDVLEFGGVVPRFFGVGEGEFGGYRCRIGWCEEGGGRWRWGEEGGGGRWEGRRREGGVDPSLDSFPVSSSS